MSSWSVTTFTFSSWTCTYWWWLVLLFEVIEYIYCVGEHIVVWLGVALYCLCQCLMFIWVTSWNRNVFGIKVLNSRIGLISSKEKSRYWRSKWKSSLLFFLHSSKLISLTLFTCFNSYVFFWVLSVWGFVVNYLCLFT